MHLKEFFVTTAIVMMVVRCEGQVVIDPNDSVIVRARANLENVERLVISGVLPRLRLDQAKENLEDAHDIAILHQTLYGKELTVDQADEMISAAKRRVDRKHHAVAEMRKLLNQGIISKEEMSTYEEDTDRTDHELDWAKSRARLVVELKEMEKQERISAQNKRDEEWQKAQAVEQAREAKERQRIRAACSSIYKNTVNKKISDLTVGEDKQVRACDTLGLYPPR